MDEVELKFQVPAAARAAVDAAVSGRDRPPRVRLQAAYFDTADRSLARAGLALRIRREGRHWVQTLKGAASDGMTRQEQNVPLGAVAAMPAVDIQRHAGTAIGRRLLALLGPGGAAALTVLYRTDILRRTRAVRSARGRLEIAFDAGSIHAGAARVGVLELEIERLAGSPRAVLDAARHWVPRFDLWLDSRSKAERGDLLARGEAVAPPRVAGDVTLAASMSAAHARAAVLRSCADQIVVNASQIASGEHAAEHVHQLRVGLRRLRSGLRLFKSLPDSGLDAAAATLFRQLGTARDLEVIDGEFGADLLSAMGVAGLPGGWPQPAASAVEPVPAERVREPTNQLFLLDLLEASQPPEPTVAAQPPQPHAIDVQSSAAEPPVDLTELVAHRLKRWHQQLVRDAKRFASLDDEARHRLRKHAKRQRYAAEFCAGLFERRALRRYLRALRALQEHLGALSDVLMAMQSFAARRETDPLALFALGWLAARREVLIKEAAPALKAFVKVESFWKA